MFGRGKASPPKAGPPPLRDMALTGDLPPRPPDAPGRAVVAMMEMSRGGALATVCSYVDGATSLYISTGGGVIGVGEDARANAASRAFVADVEAALESLALTDSSPALPEGHTRFLLRIGNELYGTAAADGELMDERYPLHHLWVSGQQVLTWIRIVSEERQGR